MSQPQSGKTAPSVPPARRAPTGAWEALVRIVLILTGAGAVVGVFVLVGMGKLESQEGLPWVIATTTSLAMLRNGHQARKN